MSAKVTIEQTDVGWNVEVSDADLVDVVTAGTSIAVSVHPDDDDTHHGKPLAVNLEPSVT